jgi:hypothetical protein
MKRISFIILLFAYGFLSVVMLEAQTTGLSSQVQLSIDRYIINHRFGLHALKINIEMDGVPVSIEDKMANEIKDFLANYPNQEDYWEIVNKKLIVFLSRLYPTQNKIQTIISIEPDSNKPFSRKSICKLHNGEIEWQVFSFSILNHAFRNNLLNLNIEIHYDCNASTNDYINFFAVKDVIEIFTEQQGKLNLSESAFPEKIARHLLSHFTSAKGFSVIVEIPPHACNPNRCYWKATAIREEMAIKV